MMIGRKKIMKTMRRNMGTTSMIAAGILGVGIATALFVGMRSRHM